MKDSRSHRRKNGRIASHLVDVPRSGIRDFFDIVSTRNDIISLSIGEPDFESPWHVREASIFALEKGHTSYTSNLGIWELREAVSRYVKDVFKIAYDPASEVLITVGVSEAMDLALRAILDPGDEVLYHEPCYVSYSPVTTFAHGRAVAVPTNREEGFRLTAGMLEKHLTDRTKALVLNFPTNPTGAVLQPRDMEGIAAFAVEHDLIVITDDIYAELSYDSAPTSIAALPGMKDRTILLNGFSKAWAMTGYRIGFSCAPPDITEAMMKIHQYTMLCAPVLSQKAALEALRNGREDCREMKNEYVKRRNLIYHSLNEIGLPCSMLRGAFYAFPYVGDYGIPSKDFSLKLLEEEKVACVPGTAFGKSGEGFIRCSYATDIEEIKEAMKRLRNFTARL
ncbi:MAG: aminotransferase class I/II-fold pyridoxal phosphate-dependent enzyme [Kiritimatiellia bacterium]